MSRLNFTGCRTLGDVASRYGEHLPGNVLVQAFNLNTPNNFMLQRSPILGFHFDAHTVAFELEKNLEERYIRTFRATQEVIYSINEPGDVHWTPDDWDTAYSIDDLSGDEIGVNTVLHYANSLPNELTGLWVPSGITSGKW